MVTRILLGLASGGAAGMVYNYFGRCNQGVCALEWNSTIPVAGGAALGLFIVLTSRWD